MNCSPFIYKDGIRDTVAKKALIEVRNLKKIYSTREGKTVLALKDVSFDVFDGEFVTIVGPSGCGKSTLLLILAGLLQPSEGTVRLNGTEVRGPQRNIGMIFQNPVLLRWRRIIENVMLPVEVLGLDRERYRKKALDLLRLANLPGFESKYPDELSGGMQQRVSICRALVFEPSLLLMDEPFGALDAMTRDALNLELLRIWSSERKTVVFVTHYIPEAVFLADRVIVLSSRPAEVIEEVKVDLLRPRTWKMKATRKFVNCTEGIRKSIGLEER